MARYVVLLIVNHGNSLFLLFKPYFPILMLYRRLLIVAHAERRDNIRIISARELTRRERKAYEEEINRRKK
ncbi:MAG: BrnT family toxin [Deltaproteobacteria bacterium]|nr:BrnT family toxin [Deltaproteobacteria bacterium]